MPHGPKGAWEGLYPRTWGALWASRCAPRHAFSHVGCWLVLNRQRVLWALSFGEGLWIPGLAFLGRKPGDGVEFFTQMRLILKKEEGRRSLPCPEVRMDLGHCRVAWGTLCQASSPAPSTSGLHPSIPSLDHPPPRQPQDPHLRRPSPHHPLLGPIAQQLTSPHRACGPQPWPESPDPGGGKGGMGSGPRVRL